LITNKKINKKYIVSKIYIIKNLILIYILFKFFNSIDFYYLKLIYIILLIMNLLIKKLKSFILLENNILLGRWSKLKSKEDINRRVYLANIDHCGTSKYEKKIKIQK